MFWRMPEAKTWPLVVILLALAAVSVQAATLRDIRYGEHTSQGFHRFVLDISSKTAYQTEFSPEKGELYVYLDSAGLECDKRYVMDETDNPIREVVVEKQKASPNTRVRFVLRRNNLRPMDFDLDNPERYRVVVDFYDESTGKPINPNQRNFKVVIIDPGHGGWDSGAQKYGIKEKDIVLDISKRLQKYFHQSDNYQAFLTRDRDVLPFVVSGAPDPNDPAQRKRLRQESLQGRIEFANRKFSYAGTEYTADLFISIHVNYFRRTSARGFEIFIPGERISEDEMTRHLLAIENGEEEKLLDNIHRPEAKSIALRLITEKMRELNPLLAYHMEKRLKQIDSRNYVSRGVKQGPFRVLRNLVMPSLLVEVGFLSNPIDRRQYLTQEWFREWVAYSLYMGVNDYFGFSPGQKPPRIRKPTPQYVVYQVRKGDCLSDIGRKFGIPYTQIKRYNGLRSNNLKPGQRLKIPTKG
jgi:N-acetylmuramoyl-L-alanine amidase